MKDILLDYSERRGWYADVSYLQYITMSDETFQKHVNAHLERQGITEPTQEQLIQARQHCRRLSFWDGCHDPEVKRHVFGIHAIEQREKDLSVVACMSGGRGTNGETQRGYQHGLF